MCMQLNCSKTGNKGATVPESQDVASGDEQMEESDDLSHVAAFSFDSKLGEEERCDGKEPLSLWDYIEGFRLDGLASEWGAVETSAIGTDISGSAIPLKFAVTETGLALFIGYSWDGSAIDINFHTLTKHGSQTLLQPGFKLIFTKDAIFREKNGVTTRIDSSDLAAFSFTDEGVEILVSHFLLDGVQYFPVWTVSIEIEPSSQSIIFPTQVRSSSYQGNQVFDLASCDLARDGHTYTIHWITATPLPSVTISEIRSLLQVHAHTYASLLPIRDSIIVLQGQMSTTTREMLPSVGILGVDTSQWRYPENRLWDNSRQIQQILQEQMELHLKHYDKALSPLTPIFSVASSLSLIRQKIGIYGYLQAFSVISQVIPEFSMAQLGLFLSLDSSQGLTMATLIKRCQEEEENLMLCFLGDKLDQDDPGGALDEWQAGNSDILLLEPWRIQDLDGDGVPGGIEAEMQTNDTYQDSDFDGWSDLTELVLASDPRVSVNHPDGLVVDGTIGDWFNLIPRQVRVDSDEKVDACEVVNIGYFGAIIVSGKLLISAKLGNESHQSFKWEVSIQQEDAELVIFEVWNNSNFFTAKGRYRIDVPFHFQKGELEIVEAVNAEAKDLSIQIRVYEEGKFCDDTPWFQPTMSSLQLTSAF